MKYALTFLVISLISMNANAQANEGISNYILQKQLKATQLKLNSESKIQQLRNLPSNGVHFVNTTPKVVSTEEALLPPTPEELEALETAAGGESVSPNSDKAAKVSTK